jgi:hypothetical protein
MSCKDQEIYEQKIKHIQKSLLDVLDLLLNFKTNFCHYNKGK